MEHAMNLRSKATLPAASASPRDTAPDHHIRHKQGGYTMRKYIIDRLEETLAVCEDELKKLVTIPREQLPKDLKEGDILKEEEGTFLLDQSETEERRSRIRKKLMDLFE